MVVLTLAGILSYFKLGRAEDPDFTFKAMVVRTLWPGATAQEVEQQVTERIEKKLQEVPWADVIRSNSKSGESLVFIILKDYTPKKEVPEAWYQVRKKIGDIRHTFPAGIQGPVTLRYTVYAWDLSVRSAHLDQTHGFFNGTSVFLAAHGQEDAPHRVNIRPPKGLEDARWRVATSLPEAAGEKGAAERYGFLGQIDRWVLRRYCEWLAANPRHQMELGQVNINLSAPSLLDPEFHDLLDELLDTHRLPATRLCLEITEMVALAELGSSAGWIERLRRRGLRVALDDFGSGFASYAYLRHLPLDLLKIDGTFVRGIEHDPINRAMVGSMVQIARQLGLRTVAEFVESAAAQDCLRELGIDYAQGYFIGRPHPLAELADALAAEPLLPR